MIDIDKLIGESMKSHATNELRAYKNLKAEIQKYKTAKNAKPYTEEAELKIISKYIKTLEDSISDFSKAGREDLVAEYTVERDILKKFLPEPATDAEIRTVIFQYANSTMYLDESLFPEIPRKKMGECIKFVKSKLTNADGRLVSQIVQDYVVLI